MRDMAHNFAQFVSQNEYLSIEIYGSEESSINTLNEKVCYLTVNFGLYGASFPTISTDRLKRLRSLLVHGYYSSCLSEFLQELLSESRCLRALDFGDLPESYDMIKEIQTNAGRLVHLRYLNLHGQSMETLPEMLCELYNLQYLNVAVCRNLRELPQGMER